MILLTYSTSLYAEVYTYFLQSGFYLQIRTLEGTSYHDLLDNDSIPFVLFLLTPNTQPEIINNWGFELHGLDHNDQPTLIGSTLQNFALFLSNLDTQNPTLLPEISMSLLDYDSIIQVNYVVANFSEILTYTNLVNPLPVMDNTDDSPYISGCDYFPQTGLFTVSGSISAGISHLSCLYGCPYKPKNTADASYHHQKKHKQDRDKIKSTLALDTTCPFCRIKNTFGNFYQFARHMSNYHKDKNYKDYLDCMK